MCQRDDLRGSAGPWLQTHSRPAIRRGCRPRLGRLNWPPFRPDTRHSSEGLGISSSTCLQRIELITGTARRRRWTTEQKLRIIEASCEPGESVSSPPMQFRGGPDVSVATGFFRPYSLLLRPDANDRTWQKVCLSVESSV